MQWPQAGLWMSFPTSEYSVSLERSGSSSAEESVTTQGMYVLTSGYTSELKQSQGEVMME